MLPNPWSYFSCGILGLFSPADYEAFPGDFGFALVQNLVAALPALPGSAALENPWSFY
jgi:hypothetical protein